MVYKFLNEYLAKLQLLTAGSTSSSDEGSSLHNNQGEGFTPRSSVSSIFDFNNKERIEQ